ncbi:ribosomal protein L24E [Aspergillus luchuensis]|uniref:Ribosomal protein L24E n=1 Tax=Aspergillus kawachii TaxID=1069201 RepID=A0A146F0Q5_ASPKA|nr:ribosomal protein L24E [Aspergillus luchuensis IFO 4308]GAT19806.1 ribosomal protein L24E [Aspergillus luchuensis]
MTSQMYGYPPYSPMNPVQPPPYGPNTSPQQHPLTTQPLMVPHPTSTAQLPHHPAQAPTGNLSSSPNSAAAQQPTPPQRTMLNPPHSAASGAPLSASAVHHQNSNVGASSSAAPGPIPATTPLVVRQDSNGVQWIAFEYSRDRVKMEYTIRCDVESVNVDNLSQEFKTENCVYPRACCSKDQYRGNRLVYETECNAVGWALAELNPALRGKRGLIQRAVDSWRNSNQDPRLRSRRVRRMAKINKRQGMPVPPPHMASSTPVGPGVPSASMPAPGPRPSLGPLPMGPPQLHHHHAQPDGSAGHEEASGTTDYTNGTSRPPVSDGLQPGPSPTDIRTAQVFHGYPSYPTPATASGGPRGPSIPPLLRDSGLGSLGRHPTIATSSNRIEEVDDDDDERNPSSDALFGTLPEGKRRKFILVDDNQRGCRVRVKVMLDQVDMDELPDSYRMSNAVYPRTYFPVQMRDPGRVVPGNRYIKDHVGVDEEDADDDDSPTVGRIMVPAPQIDVDAYRNKMRSTMLAAGQEPTSIPRHFETRAGKRRFLERKRRAAGGPTRGAGAHGVSASQRSAEEVEA